MAAGDPDVEEWNFDEGPMVHKDNSDLQWAFHLMAFFHDRSEQSRHAAEIIQLPRGASVVYDTVPGTSTE